MSVEASRERQERIGFRSDTAATAGESDNSSDTIFASLAEVPRAEPFVGPDQAALEQMLPEMTAGVE